MNKNKILIIEDDENIARLVSYNLEEAGFVCKIASTAIKGLNAIQEENFDLVILDIMLPGGMDGFEICRKIRQNISDNSLAIIILTAKGEEIDRIIGLELGADDYIVKPFSPRELVLRVKAVLRRRSNDNKEVGDNILNIDGIRMDVDRHIVEVDGKQINLTSMEFKLLHILLKRKGRVQSRERLLQDVWNMDADVNTRTIDTHVKRLRQKLGEKGYLLETVRGFGYRIKD